MYIVVMEFRTENRIGEIIKQKRVSIPLTLYELGANSGVSQSHIRRIERGERVPSAHVLRRIAKPLGFKEEELFMLAGFLSSASSEQENSASRNNYYRKIDPFVTDSLSCESVTVQRAVIGILRLLKYISRSDRKL
jgi:transcriptional regulator with XRE-family HTH domain